MNFKINSSELKQYLEKLQKVSKSKSTLPILSYFKLELTDDSLTVTATDLELTVVVSIVPENIITIGEVCVIADKFADVVKSMKDEIVSFSANDKNMKVKSKSGTFTIPTLSTDEFPELSNTNQQSFEVPSITLLDGIKRTMYCVEYTDLRPILNGVLLDLHTDKTIITATNATKMALCYSDPIVANSTSVLIPLNLGRFLASVIDESLPNVEMFISDTNVSVRVSEYMISCKKIEGTYPNYMSVIPQNHTHKAEVNTELLLDSLKRATIFANTVTSSVVVDIADGVMKITSKDVDFALESVEEIECKTEGVGFFATNGKLLIEHISRITTDFVELSYSENQNRPIIIKPVGNDKTVLLLTQQLVH